MESIDLIRRYFKFQIYKLPETANYDITGKCNAKCKHCYFFKSWDSSRELSDEEWISAFKKHRQGGICYAVLTGGEPMLRPKLIEAADKIFEIVLIVSNGIIKIPEHINRRIFISIDGNKETHESIRRIRTFDQIMKNIKNDKRVVLSPTLSTLNYNQIDEIIRIAIDQNVFGVTFSLYAGESMDDALVLKGEKLDYTIKKLKEALKRNKDIVLLTEKMINTFKDKKHIKNCFLRSKWVVSYYPDLKIKTPCVLGEKIECKTCGCIIPVIMYALSRFDFAALGIIKKFFPSYAYAKYLDKRKIDYLL